MQNVALRLPNFNAAKAKQFDVNYFNSTLNTLSKLNISGKRNTLLEILNSQITKQLYQLLAPGSWKKTGE